MAKALRIVAKRNNFRRAGLAHPETAVDHPLDRFDKKQVEALKADPMLVVNEVEIGDSPAADDGSKAKGGKGKPNT